MSRIRSIHPGLWTDENFVSVSAYARILFMGIWTECDDKGSFVWSPLKLKMRLLPADNIDAGDLLDELLAANLIAAYEVDGKSYGAVRNFCKFQRPKKPNDIYPQTPEIAKFAAFEAPSEAVGSEPVPNQFRTDTEKPKQMEDGGGNKPPYIPPKQKANSVAKPESVTDQVWSDFLAARKAKRSPLTETALAGIAREAQKAGWSLNDALAESVARGWQAFKAEWVEKRSLPAEGRKQTPAEWLAFCEERVRNLRASGPRNLLEEWEEKERRARERVGIPVPKLRAIN